MEVVNLSRTQSLRSLPWIEGRRWNMTAATRWERKSVSQLVEHYQSCGDLRSLEKVETKPQLSNRFPGERRRGQEGREKMSRGASSNTSSLSRSRSMDCLSPKEASGTRSLCALFESKGSLQNLSHSSSGLFNSSASANCGKRGRDRPLQDWRSHDTSPQRVTPEEGARTSDGLRVSSSRSPRYPSDRGDAGTHGPRCVTQTLALGGPGDHGIAPLLLNGQTKTSATIFYWRGSEWSEKAERKGDKNQHRAITGLSFNDRHHPSLTKAGTQLTRFSVRERSALYLSRAASIDSVGGSTQPGPTGTSGARIQGPRTKSNKMAEAARKVTVSQSSHDEDDLPLPPPPPPVPARPLDYEGPSALNSLPLPPPKETFSTYYQQRQKTELKRIFKHIHPDILGDLGEGVDDEIMRAVQLDDADAADAANQCEVQSMRWIFENWNLDSIGDPHSTKKLLDEEDITGGNVRGTSSMFENSDRGQQKRAERLNSVRGDVRTSTWLFETQPLDSLHRTEDGELVEAVLKEAIQPGDVCGTRLLFETKPLSDLGRCNSIEDQNFLKLKSELQEQKGDVQKTVKLFQAEPRCAIRDKSGNIHSIKSICREEIKNGNTSSTRWLFETQPLDLISKGTDGVKIIRGISLEEGHKGGTDRKRWMFETQSFDDIKEVVVDKFEGTGEVDVTNKTKLFEMQPLATLRGNAEEKSLERENVIGGDVKTSLWLFETRPMETLNDSYEVGCLEKVTLSAVEKGAVKDKKIIFEGGSAGKSISVKEQEIEKGDVRGFKQLFETIPLSRIAPSDENCDKENVAPENATQEDAPLYAIKDSSGNFYKITTVNREEFIKGKVQNYKWMFETKLLNELTEGKENVEVIKGITREEDTMGDVKLAKWLFETQTIEGIHSKFNQTEPSRSLETEPRKGNVKTCKWLFETRPMDIPYDKSEKVKDTEAIDNPSVKSITWLFESQPLDTIKEDGEYKLKLCDTIQNSVKSEAGGQTVKHLIETETLDEIGKGTYSDQDVRCVSQVNVQSGDVSRVKELFESRSLDEIGSEMAYDEQNDENIQKGSVHKFTWLFENCPMNTINKDKDDASIQRVIEDVSGDVKNKKFIFETSSLDKIHDQPLEQKPIGVEEPVGDIDVKSSTMMFESLPLYAIRDKEGEFHEVTTVQKEEILSGDVRGARWMFETKPLEAIKAENEVYVIRAVTQEDVEKGDVKSARWKFETQPLDSLTCREEPSVKVIDDFGSCNVQLNKKIFESEESNDKFVRMVSVTDIQRGDVRTSTWLFENQNVDTLRGEHQEQGPVKTVYREDSQKGDVKRCTWMFESQPLDKIKQQEETSFQGTEETIPKADVKCTTWLFETTPLDKITSSSVTDTVVYLSELNLIHSGGIIVEANDGRNVTMAKFQLGNSNEVQIQKEEVVEGNLRNIMLQLLLKPTNPQVTLLKEAEKGQVTATKVELPVYHSSTTITLERDQIIQDIVQMIDEMLVQDKNFKKGILMQETTGGQAEMSVYLLSSQSETKAQSPAIERGDVKSTIGNLLATANSQKTAASCRIDENEKGNVNLYKSCIEKGDLHYLKSLHSAVSEDETDCNTLSKEQTEIVQGDVREAKRSLCQQKELVERTISDVLPGDVKNTKKVFISECAFVAENSVPKDEIIPGDVSTAKQQLATKQEIVVEKENIVAGDVKATMQSLERAKQQSMCVEREVFTPGTIYDMDLSCPEAEEAQVQKEMIICGDVKAAKKSLELAKQQSMHPEREVIVPGKIYNLEVSAQKERSPVVTQSSSSRSQQVKTYSKVSDTMKDLDNCSLEACQQGDVSHFSAVIVSDNVPFVSYECNGLIAGLDESEDVIKGDVKAAIRSLQSVATEQRLPDKEDVVGGSVHQALKSLERSSVNVSKGDFKSAMLYRKSESSERGVVVSVPPSDTTLSPSISVTCQGKPSITARKPTCYPVENKGSERSSSEVEAPLLQKTPQDLKPALPPKPHLTKPVFVDDVNVTPAKKPTAGTHPDAKQRTQLPTNRLIEGTRARTGHKSDYQVTKSNTPELEMERNVIQRINAAEEIQKCMKDYEDNPKHEMNMGLQAALKNFERTGSETLNKKANFLPTKTVKNDKVESGQQTSRTPNCRPMLSHGAKQLSAGKVSETNIAASPCQSPTTNIADENEHRVVLREKKGKETEVERRQRLSVHKDEIMKGNVKAAMEIFENIRKREELKGILSQVQEIEGATGLKTVCDSVPAWVASLNESSKQNKQLEKKVETETRDDDLESVSSVETAYEDLEKASKEILNLKDQTLAKLLDIEEVIKKALYSVSNLKSEADIAGLSGLFDESLVAEQHIQPANKVRKISIASTKAQSGQSKETTNLRSLPKKEAPGQVNNKLIRQSSSQSSPSFISIHSAARRPAEQPKPAMSTFKPALEEKGQSCPGHSAHESGNSPAKHKVSMLEVQTVPKEPAGIIGTKTVSETYEETDGFGNVFVSSVKSTFVTKQSDSMPAALFEVVGSPTRYQVMTSPLVQRSSFPPKDEKLSKTDKKGKLFVPFSQPNKGH
ncbi:xin actin-binding repeat-containing protein 1 [Nerophis ophidion]|uniref:xin actin-binding repeat-containing protein 1 n=1 Tax=Nerophis ophidion TaxID=159077 RepID=UPI002ADFE43C|nr:xin actin-binding repeat-containing protein 1 [Nerophis ophidion]